MVSTPKIDKSGDDLSARVSRLNWAVKQAGGHKLVAQKSGINGRTLSHLLAGQDLNGAQLLALSKATGFGVEWIMTGRAVEPISVPSADESLAGSGEISDADDFRQITEYARKKLEEGRRAGAEADLTVQGREHATRGPVSRLNLAVQEAGGPQAVAVKAGLPVGRLRNYLAGHQMNRASLPAIAKATGVSLAWLATGQGTRFDINTEASPPAEFRAVLDRADELAAQQAMIRPSPGTVLIARYDARASAGDAALLNSDAVIEKIAFSESWVRTVLRRNPDHLALIEARGDSMEPTIRDGDVLMIDTSVTEVHSARVYVLDLAGSLIVKRVQRMVSGGYRIISDNKDRYDVETFTPTDRNPLRVVGEVVWWSGIAR